MRIATWNLDHRAGRGRVTPARLLTQALHEMAVDVVVLTEFVPRRSPGFEAAIREAGLAYLEHSELKGSGNNVLIASRHRLEPGRSAVPDFGDQDAQTNVLHMRLADPGIDILGLRIPAYAPRHENWKRMWDWIDGAAKQLKDVPAVILGDFNVDPNPDRMSKKWQCPDRLQAMEKEWQRVPTTGASYWSVGRSPAGHVLSRPRQLDHAFVSRHLHVREALYQTTTASCVLVDPEKPRSREAALSDHAALIVEIELAI